jgi:K+-transporting ATPase ATPase C chain
MLVVLSVLTGVVYPLATWGIAQLAFPRAANGSLIEANGKTVGSTLIGQPFDDPKYFWSRPSATSPQPYNGGASSGSNQGAHRRCRCCRRPDQSAARRRPGDTAPVPADLVTASASGRPDISLRR